MSEGEIEVSGQDRMLLERYLAELRYSGELIDTLKEVGKEATQEIERMKQESQRLYAKASGAFNKRQSLCNKVSEISGFLHNIKSRILTKEGIDKEEADNYELEVTPNDTVTRLVRR